MAEILAVYSHWNCRNMVLLSHQQISMPDHLKLDTEFLDIKEPIKGPAKDPNWVFSGKAPESEKSKKSSGKPFTHNWKLILLAVGIVLLISWAAVTQDNSSSSNTATPANAPTSNSTGQTLNLNSQNNTVVVGHYTCSSYDADQADSLQPSDAVSKQLDADEKKPFLASQLGKVVIKKINIIYSHLNILVQRQDF